MVTELIRGIRDNDPGNLNYDPSIHWQGLIGPEPEGRFCLFDTMQNGIRAAGIVLLNYVGKDKIPSTVDALITRFAPGTENPTSAYIANVCRHVGVGPNDTVNLHDVATMSAFLSAIFVQENGIDGAELITADELSEGVAAALAHG